LRNGSTGCGKVISEPGAVSSSAKAVFKAVEFSQR
jgi:hypothetical protein